MAVVAALLCALGCVPPDTARLRDVFDPARITSGSYELLMYAVSGDTTSDPVIVRRAISHVKHQGREALRIVERNTTKGHVGTTTVHVDAKTLALLSFEAGEPARDTSRTMPPGSFVSNSFSELLQANDFATHPVVRFSTFAPGSGNPPNEYIAERLRVADCGWVSHSASKCFLVRFTRVGADGTAALAGYRYIDAASGKVLAYRSNFETNSYFTYRVLGILPAHLPLPD